MKNYYAYMSSNFGQATPLAEPNIKQQLQQIRMKIKNKKTDNKKQVNV